MATFDFMLLPLGKSSASAPIFIVGTGRCGTTLLRLILNRHRQLAILGESHALFKDLRYGPLSSERSLARFCRDWTISFLHCTPRPDVMQSAELRTRLVRAASYAEAISVTASYYASLEGKSRWGEQSPGEVQHLGKIVKAFPNAKIIHMTRDPRATVHSFILHTRKAAFSAANIYNTAKYWARCEHLANAFHTLSPQNIKRVRYEDLVADPRTTVRDICGFVGVAFEEAMLETASTALRYAPKGDDGRVLGSHQGLLENVSAAETAKWKQALSPQAVRLIEAATWKWLVARGYAGPVRPRMARLFLEIGWQFDRFKLGAQHIALRAYWIARLLFEYVTNPVTVPEEQAETREATR